MDGKVSVKVLVNVEDQAALRGYLPGDRLLHVLRFDVWLPSLADVGRLLATVLDELTEPNWVSAMRVEYDDKQGDRGFRDGDVVVVGETAWANQPCGFRKVSVAAQQIHMRTMRTKFHMRMMRTSCCRSPRARSRWNRPGPC